MEQNKGAMAREDKPCTKTTLVNRPEQYQFPKYGKAMGCIWISVPLAAPCASQRASDTACNAGCITRNPLLLLARKTLRVLPWMPSDGGRPKLTTL